MKISINWLKELVELKVATEEVIKLLPLRTIGLKEVTSEFFELDMKGYNRADLLSLRGTAKEIAAITNSEILFKDEALPKYDLPETPVKIENENLSSIQCVAKIENLKFAESPKDWIKKLNSCGMRTVNNIADVTNLIMLEYGQPLHSFDAETVKGELIDVRLAKNGEEIRTLDNKLRKLTSEDIVLADTEKPLDVAGVMGGKDTEVKESTTTILLSASMFNPIMIRKTATRLGLHSEASKRFQHGLTKTNLLQSLNAAIKMYEGLGGKLTAITLKGDLKDEVKAIKLSQEKVNSLIGIDISPEEIKNYLEKLGFLLTAEEGGWEVAVPYWRLDINIAEDLIEEVARMYGYEKIPAKPLNDNIPTVTPNPLFALIDNLKHKLSELGLTEVQTYSYYSTTVLKNLEADKNVLIKIANPMSAETEYMRENLWPNLVEVVAKNEKQGIKDMAIFEIGKTYYKDKKDKAAEKFSLSIALTDNTDNPIAELHRLSGQLNEEFNLGIEKAETNAETKLFHPNRFIQLTAKGEVVGELAEVHRRITDKFGINQRVAVLEIDLEKIP